jgi:hypothetical protein
MRCSANSYSIRIGSEKTDKSHATRVIDASVIRIKTVPPPGVIVPVLPTNTQQPSHSPLTSNKTMSSTGQHTLPALPYPYEALEPYISRQIMELHHKKHHQTYVNALNAAEQAYAKTTTPKERIALQAALKFNGGGT